MIEQIENGYQTTNPMKKELIKLAQWMVNNNHDQFIGKTLRQGTLNNAVWFCYKEAKKCSKHPFLMEGKHTLNHKSFFALILAESL